MDHEALLYSGGYPESYTLDSMELASIITAGENVLAVQVHNVGLSSSDMSSNFFLSFGIADESTYYGSPPDWFQQPFVFTESNLPIVTLDTEGQEILDAPRITVHMGIIDNGSGINHITDPLNGYDGQISIEIRGSSSQMFPKKQYALETQDIDGENLNVSILGMPEENDWILHAPYSDKSLIRNFLAYELARDMGRYASRTRFCELVINGDYKGLYIFMEKTKRDNNRVDISKLEPDETTGDDLTGGYILKVDKWDGDNNDGWWSDPPLPEYEGVWYQYHYPKPEDIVEEQRNYIINYITDFEALIASSSYNDPAAGYYDQVDLGSFIDVSLMSEISKNVDAYRLSAFMYKDKDSDDDRLIMGPIWDYNLAFGNADYYGGWDPTG
ncbi:MAG TPA: CotH kinase family protein, partial [Candidatus Marinimicrobia bacterium]|nr:CotH kinase family protein [Candidatus Neomarinimicrobiota bacterium]